MLNRIQLYTLRRLPNHFIHDKKNFCKKNTFIQTLHISHLSLKTNYNDFTNDRQVAVTLGNYYDF